MKSTANYHHKHQPMKPISTTLALVLKSDSESSQYSSSNYRVYTDTIAIEMSQLIAVTWECVCRRLSLWVRLFFLLFVLLLPAPWRLACGPLLWAELLFIAPLLSAITNFQTCGNDKTIRKVCVNDKRYFSLQKK